MAKHKAQRNKRASDKFAKVHPEGRAKFADVKTKVRVEKKKKDIAKHSEAHKEIVEKKKEARIKKFNSKNNEKL